MADAPPEAAETRTGAARVAARLPEQAGNTPHSMARDAFTSGINTVGLICAVLLVALAIIAITLLPGDHSQPSTGTTPNPTEVDA